MNPNTTTAAYGMALIQLETYWRERSMKGIPSGRTPKLRRQIETFCSLVLERIFWEIGFGVFSRLIRAGDLHTVVELVVTGWKNVVISVSFRMGRLVEKNAVLFPRVNIRELGPGVCLRLFIGTYSAQIVDSIFNFGLLKTATLDLLWSDLVCPIVAVVMASLSRDYLRLSSCEYLP